MTSQSIHPTPPRLVHVLFAAVLLAGAVLLGASGPLSAQDSAALGGEQDPIVGTWHVYVDQPGGFNALQTFHADGTFTETSDLLATLVEGPAQGIWKRVGNRYHLTFVLFAFNPDHSPAGKIRVRAEMTLAPNGRRFDAQYEVDFIDLDGTVVPEVGTGAGVAFKQRLLGLE